jgi:hypothetical protein
MEQLFNKALTLEKSKYVKLVKALIPYTETSFSYSEIMGLAFDVLLHSPTFEQTRMPLNEYQMRSPNVSGVGSVVYYDLDFAKNLLHAFFYENVSPEDYVEANGIGKNDWYGQIVGVPSGSQKPNENNNTSNVTSSTQSKPTTSDTSSVESTVSSTPTPSQNEVTSSEDATSSEGTTSTESQPTTSSDVANSSSTPTDSSVQTPSSTPATPETPPTSSAQGTTSENASQG